MAKADQASIHLPEIATNGAQALKDMLYLSKELKRLAPMLPTMIAEVDQLLFESRAMLRAAQETWLIGDVLQNEIDLGLRMPGGLRDDPADETRRPRCLKEARHARSARTMRLLWIIGLTAGLLSACATTQPASDTANATIAKQVALADEAYELGRYGTASSRYRQALLYARSEDDAQLIAPLLHNLGTSLQQSHLCEDAQVAFQEAFDLYQSIGDDTGSLMSLLGRATCEHALRDPKAKETLEDVLKRARVAWSIQPWRPVPLLAWPRSHSPKVLKRARPMSPKRLRSPKRVRVTRPSELPTSTRDDSSKEMLTTTAHSKPSSAPPRPTEPSMTTPGLQVH